MDKDELVSLLKRCRVAAVEMAMSTLVRDIDAALASPAAQADAEPVAGIAGNIPAELGAALGSAIAAYRDKKMNVCAESIVRIIQLFEQNTAPPSGVRDGLLRERDIYERANSFAEAEFPVSTITAFRRALIAFAIEVNRAPERPSAEAEKLPKECPSCGSRNPKHHPATSAGGEVSLCHNKWHSPTADEIRAKEAEKLPQGKPNKIKLDDGAYLSRDGDDWALIRGGDQMRRLNKYECEFINAALESVNEK